MPSMWDMSRPPDPDTPTHLNEKLKPDGRLRCGGVSRTPYCRIMSPSRYRFSTPQWIAGDSNSVSNRLRLLVYRLSIPNATLVSP